MILNKIIFKLTLIIIGIVAIKIGTFYVLARLNHKKYKSKCNYNNKNSDISNKSNNIVLSSPIPKGYFKYYYTNKLPIKSPTESVNSVPKIETPIPRDTKIEEKYLQIRSMFNQKMKNKEMNRDEILALREYLNKNVFEYESNKKFKNDCHYIYSALKAKDITLEHLEEIEKFLNSIQGED